MVVKSTVLRCIGCPGIKVEVNGSPRFGKGLGFSHCLGFLANPAAAR
jgi:hypothetical protein